MRRTTRHELAAVGFILLAGGLAAWAAASIGVGAVVAVGAGLALWAVEKATGRR